jgi:hypothetical protein
MHQKVTKVENFDKKRLSSSNKNQKSKFKQRGTNEKKVMK